MGPKLDRENPDVVFQASNASLSLLAVLWFVQPRMLLALFAARPHSAGLSQEHLVWKGLLRSWSLIVKMQLKSRSACWGLFQQSCSPGRQPPACITAPGSSFPPAGLGICSRSLACPCAPHLQTRWACALLPPSPHWQRCCKGQVQLVPLWDTPHGPLSTSRPINTRCLLSLSDQLVVHPPGLWCPNLDRAILWETVGSLAVVSRK